LCTETSTPIYDNQITSVGGATKIDAVNSPNWFEILKSTILIALTPLDSSMMVCTFLLTFGPSARVSEISHAKTLGKKDLNFNTVADLYTTFQGVLYITS
jgi:hypothetical protein